VKEENTKLDLMVLIELEIIGFIGPITKISPSLETLRDGFGFSLETRNSLPLKEV
jgi:hypothetical protein